MSSATDCRRLGPACRGRVPRRRGFFLRHDARAGREGVGELDKPEFRVHHRMKSCRTATNAHWTGNHHVARNDHNPGRSRVVISSVRPSADEGLARRFPVEFVRAGGDRAEPSGHRFSLSTFAKAAVSRTNIRTYASRCARRSPAAPAGGGCTRHDRRGAFFHPTKLLLRFPHRLHHLIDLSRRRRPDIHRDLLVAAAGRLKFLPPTDLAGPSHSMFISDVFARRVHLNRPASIFHMNGLQATFDFDRFRFPKRPVFAGLAMSLHLLVAYTSLPLLQKPPTLARSVAFRPDQGSRSSGEDRPRPGREQRLR